MIKYFKTTILILIVLSGYIIFSCASLSPYTTEQKTEFEQVMMQLNTPEKVNLWIAENIVYDSDKLRINSTKRWKNFQEFWRDGINLPIKTYYDRCGVCNDFANLSGYALHKAGYKVKIVTGLKYPGAKGYDVHTVCAYKDKGKWWVAGDSRSGYQWILHGPFDSIAEVANYAAWGKAAVFYTNRRKGF